MHFPSNIPAHQQSFWYPVGALSTESRSQNQKCVFWVRHPEHIELSLAIFNPFNFIFVVTIFGKLSSSSFYCIGHDLAQLNKIICHRYIAHHPMLLMTEFSSDVDLVHVLPSHILSTHYLSITSQYPVEPIWRRSRVRG